MNYTEEYVEQLEKVITSLRSENSGLRQQLAAAEKQNETLSADIKALEKMINSFREKLAASEKQIKWLSEQAANKKSPASVVKKASLTTFFNLTNDELMTLTPEPAEEFVIKKGVLIKYKGSGGDVVIPDGVKSIGAESFKDCQSLKSVTIPGGVTNIGDRAFFGCLPLNSITVPSSLTNIGADAFFGCRELTIKCPAGSYAERYAKYKKLKISRVTGKSPTPPIRTLGPEGYELKEKMSNVTAEFVIENGMLKKYNGTDRDAVIPYGVTSVGEGAFSGCRTLTSVIIPDSVTHIGDSAFLGCKALTSVTMSGRVRRIGEGAFYRCEALMRINIPDSVTSIGGWAFYNCSALDELTVPDSVKSIGEEVFYCCRDLTVKCSAGSYAEEYCKSNGIHYRTNYITIG